MLFLVKVIFWKLVTASWNIQRPDACVEVVGEKDVFWENWSLVNSGVKIANSENARTAPQSDYPLHLLIKYVRVVYGLVFNASARFYNPYFLCNLKIDSHKTASLYYLS